MALTGSSVQSGSCPELGFRAWWRAYCGRGADRSGPAGGLPRRARAGRRSCRRTTPTRSRCGGPPRGCSRRSSSGGAGAAGRRWPRPTAAVIAATATGGARAGSTTRPTGVPLRAAAAGRDRRARCSGPGPATSARSATPRSTRSTTSSARTARRSTAQRRDARTDLTGRRALLTGGRAKIGMYIALRLLRDGAHTTITTRFPQRRRAPLRRDARQRRLAAPAADRRHRPARPGPGRRARRRRSPPQGPLDILINNAAQTVRRSPGRVRAAGRGRGGAAARRAAARAARRSATGRAIRAPRPTLGAPATSARRRTR